MNCEPQSGERCNDCPINELPRGCRLEAFRGARILTAELSFQGGDTAEEMIAQTRVIPEFELPASGDREVAMRAIAECVRLRRQEQ